MNDDERRETHGGMVAATLVIVLGGLAMLAIFATTLAGIIEASGGWP